MQLQGFRPLPTPLGALGVNNSDLDDVYLETEARGILYPHQSTLGYRLLAERVTSIFRHIVGSPRGQEGSSAQDSPLKVAGTGAGCASKAQSGWEGAQSCKGTPGAPGPALPPTALHCWVGIQLYSISNVESYIWFMGVTILLTTGKPLTLSRHCSKCINLFRSHPQPSIILF